MYEPIGGKVNKAKLNFHNSDMHFRSEDFC